MTRVIRSDKLYRQTGTVVGISSHSRDVYCIHFDEDIKSRVTCGDIIPRGHGLYVHGDRLDILNSLPPNVELDLEDIFDESKL